MLNMNYLTSICTILNAVLFVNCEISKALRDYIDNKNRLQKYSVTKLVDYEKNRSTFMEENLFLQLKDAVSVTNTTYMKQKVLNVSVFQKVNHEFDCRIRKINNETIVEGYSINMLKDLQDILHFKVHYNIIENVSNLSNTSLEELLLHNNTIDLMLCHPETNNTLTNVLHPTLESRYVLIYKPSKLSFTEDIFILTFAGTLWLCFIIVLIVLAIFLWIFTRQYHRIYGYAEWGTVEITFWAIATACQQGLSSTPYGFASRLVVFLGATLAYLLYTGFAAGITSLVAVQNQNFDITIADIERMKLKVVSFGSLNGLPAKYNYLRNSWTVSDMETFFEQLDQKKSIGVTLKILLDQYLAKMNSNIDYCSFVISVIAESRLSMSNLVPKKSPYRKIFNYWIMRKDEPSLRRMDDVPEVRTNLCYTSSGYSSARLEHVRSAIAVLLVGLVVSFVFLVCECIWNGYKHRKQRSRRQLLAVSNNQ